MPDDFYPFVDSGDPAPDNAHITGLPAQKQDSNDSDEASEQVSYATRIAIYDDMLSTPRVIVVSPKDVRSYLEEVTNTVYRCMKEQGGGISLMVIREIVENFIHAHFVEPIISILDDGNTIRFADQGPGIEDKERAFEFGVTSADRDQKRYIRGTGAGFPMVQQYLENAGGAISIEDNLHQGTVVTVSIDPNRAAEIEQSGARGAAVRGHAMPAMPDMSSIPMAPEGTPPSPAQGRMPQNPSQPYPAQQFAQQPQGAQRMQQPQMPYGQQPAWGYQQPTYPAPAQMGYPAGAYPQQMPYQQQWPQQPYGQPWGQNPWQTGWQQPQQGYPQAAPGPAGGQAPYVSERGALALRYLAEHGSGGPTDLAGAFGSSTPTWSRELEALARAGLVIKRGQKRFLTEMGKLWTEEQQ